MNVRMNTHTVSGLYKQSPLAWKDIAGYNNYSLAGLLVVGPLFQQSGFSLVLDADQFRLYNKNCVWRQREKEGERKKKTEGVRVFMQTYIN